MDCAMMFYDSPCIIAQAKTTGKIHGVGHHTGEYAMAVKWFERDVSDPERRTFHLGNGPVECFNCSDLRAISIQMAKLPMPKPVDVRKRSARVRGLAPPETIQIEQRWKLPAATESKILQANW